MNSSRLISLLVSSALAISLSACNTTPTATGAQLVSGPITALSASSLTVSGKTFSLNSAAAKSRSKSPTNVSINGDAAKPGALSVGQHVTVKADGSDATDVDIDLELKGTITGVDVAGGTIDIAGQIVIVSSLTRIDLGNDEDTAPSTLHTISDLKAGDFVEVTGTTDPVTGNITASKIEVKTDKEIGEDGDHKDNHIKGTVSGLTATSFALGTITVNCTAPCTLPTGLKNGDTVHVKGTLDATGLILTATKVHIDGEFHKHPLPGSSVVLDRKIQQLDETTKTFKLCYLTVDYSAATVTGTLAAKARVKVEGVVDATDATLVHATTVTVLAADEPNDDGSHGDHGHHGGSNGGVPGPGGNPENPGKK
jgi:cytoskeletal protein CcmA (bactofilin family)